MKLKFWKKCHLSVKLKVKLKEIFLDIIPFNLIIILNTFLISWICNKPIEAILFLAAHFALRYKFDKAFHCKTDNICLATTCSIIDISVILIIPLEYSLLFSCVSALGICWLGYIIQDRIELKYEQSEYKKNKDAEVYYGMDEILLRAKCKIHLLTKLATDRLVKRYCYNMTIDEIAFDEKVEFETIKQSLRRSRKKLKIKDNEDA